MKHLVFAAALLVCVPLAAWACHRSRLAAWAVFATMVWATCEPNPLGISFETREFYRAAVRGFEVFLTDLCALALGIGCFLGKDRDERWAAPPLTVPYAVFFTIGVLSWSLTSPSLPLPTADPGFVSAGDGLLSYGHFETSLYPLFELSRLLRGYLVFWVVANFVRANRSETRLWVSLALPLLWVSARALLEYIELRGIAEQIPVGHARPTAGLMNPNSMAIYALIPGAALLPSALQADRRWVRYMSRIAISGAVLCVLMSASRSSLVVLFLLGLFALRVLRPRRISLRAAVVGVVAVLLAISFSQSLVERIRSGSGYGPRHFLVEQARAMAAEHPFGVGLGNFSAYSWHRQDPRGKGEEAGVPAHDIWFLTAAEVGVPGALALLAIWIRTGQLIWETRKRARPQERLLIDGLALAFAALLLQSFLHYAYRDNAVYYLIQISAGILVGLYGRQRARLSCVPEVPPETAQLQRLDVVSRQAGSASNDDLSAPGP